MLSAFLGACPALAGAGADQVTLDIRQTAQHGNHHPPRAGRGIGPRLGKGQELPTGIHNLLDDGEQLERRSGEAVDPRHHQHVAALYGFEEAGQLFAVGDGAAHLLAVHDRAACGSKLFELGL